MIQSRIVSEQKIYLKFDDEGKTELVKSASLVPGYNYRRVHYTREDQVRTSFLFGTKVFQDPEYKVNEAELSSLEPQGDERIVLRRLYDLYNKCPKSANPQFFPPKNYIPPRKLSSDPYLPPFSTEIGVFPVEYYKSFFITQEFSKNGMYEIIINNRGRFETDVVDDWVPVREHSLQPIWGMQMDNAWQIILLKFWAKRNGGYNNVKSIPPFYFLEFFSNSNWKYYNLQIDGGDFLNFYTGRAQDGKFILKTKNSQMVQRAGLIPNSAGYELINLVQTTPGATNKPTASIINGAFTNDNTRQLASQNKKDRKWVATIRSTMVNKWTGGMSILDKEINDKYYPQQYKMNLDRDFMITETDLLNLFSTAYIASRRDSNGQNYYSDYYILNVEPNNKKAIYLKFDLPRDGWFDFCIKQFDDNRVTPTTASRVKAEQYNKGNDMSDGLRYLKIKYLLVKVNNTFSPSTFSEPDYQPLPYDTYEIEYSQGYNRGDARFLSTVRGTYILKIKPQPINRNSYFVVNYASDSAVDLEEYFPSKQQSSLIQRSAMSSLIGLVTSYHLDTKQKWEEIVFANVFEEIGYGFVGARSKKNCPYRILIDVDPVQVKNSGYKIKNQFKTLTQPFSVFVAPGESTSVVLKKIPGVKYSWPPAGIEVFRQK